MKVLVIMGYASGDHAGGDDDRDWLVAVCATPEAARRTARSEWPKLWGAFPVAGDIELNWPGQQDGRHRCYLVREEEVIE